VCNFLKPVRMFIRIASHTSPVCLAHRRTTYRLTSGCHGWSTFVNYACLQVFSHVVGIHLY
jgi:hypothetical protein